MKNYWEPVLFKNSTGKPRRVGFELEFGNLTVRETAEALQNSMGGNIQENNPFYFKIINSSVGNLKIERDAELLKSVKYRDALIKMNVDFDPDTIVREIEQGIDRLCSFLIPCEIVTEPLNFREFPKLNEIVNVLNLLKAKGTQDSIFYAFGLHMNPSVPDLDKKTLVAYTQAFLLLTDWIIEDSEIDFSRRFFTNFIDPFPDSYVEKVLDTEYEPAVETFIDDYLDFNPTRNRALDMLPVLCEIDNDRVLAGVQKDERSLVNSRPAFHYRLPDCRVGDKKWSVADEWNRWWYVECIASDNGLRAELIHLWNGNTQEFLMIRKNKWIDTVKKFLNHNIKTPDHRP
ncbi:MAG: amidoligase family protein [Desulfobacterales bacterium]